MITEIDRNQDNGIRIMQFSPMLSMSEGICEIEDATRNVQNEQREKHAELDRKVTKLVLIDDAGGGSDGVRRDGCCRHFLEQMNFCPLKRNLYLGHFAIVFLRLKKFAQ